MISSPETLHEPIQLERFDSLNPDIRAKILDVAREFNSLVELHSPTAPKTMKTQIFWENYKPEEEAELTDQEVVDLFINSAPSLGLQDLLPATVEALPSLNDRLRDRLTADYQKLYEALSQAGLNWFIDTSTKNPEGFEWGHRLYQLKQKMIKIAAPDHYDPTEGENYFHSQNPLVASLDYRGSETSGLISHISFRLDSSGQLEFYRLGLNCFIGLVGKPKQELVEALLKLSECERETLQKDLNRLPTQTIKETMQALVFRYIEQKLPKN